MSGSEQELKKQRQQEILRNMANEAEAYQQNVTNTVMPAIEDLDQLDKSKQVKEQIEDMLLVDVKAASALEEVYPELVKDVRKKEAKLNRQANAGAIEKIKTGDFIGTKKRTAQNKLRDIKANKDALQRNREQRLFKHFNDKTAEYKAQLEEKGIDFDNLNNKYGEFNAVVEKVYKNTDRYKEKERIANEFDEVKVYYDKEESTEPKNFSGSMARDSVSLTTPFMREADAKLETMQEFQKSFFVLQTGQIVTEKGRPAATREQKLEAFNNIQETVRMKYDEIIKYEKQNPELFKDDVRMEDLADHMMDFMAWVNSQQLSDLSRLVIKSAKELELGDEVVGKLKEQREVIGAFQKYVAPMVGLLKNCSAAASKKSHTNISFDSPGYTFSYCREQAKKEVKEL